MLVNDQYEIEHEVPIHNDPLKGPNRHDFHTVEGGSRSLAMTWNIANASSGELATLGLEEQPSRVRYGGFQEHDIDTLELLFDWSAEGHVYLNESYTDANCQNFYGWDYF